MVTEILKDAVHKAMRLVTSADKAYHYLRSMGYEFSRREVRDAWKNVGASEYWSTVIETWGVDKPLPSHWVVESPRLKSAPYEIVYNVRFMDVDTGEEFVRRIGFLSDERLTFAEGWEEIEAVREKYQVVYNAIILEWAPYAYIKRVE